MPHTFPTQVPHADFPAFLAEVRARLLPEDAAVVESAFDEAHAAAVVFFGVADDNLSEEYVFEFSRAHSRVAAPRRPSSPPSAPSRPPASLRAGSSRSIYPPSWGQGHTTSPPSSPTLRPG